MMQPDAEPYQKAKGSIQCSLEKIRLSKDGTDLIHTCVSVHLTLSSVVASD